LTVHLEAVLETGIELQANEVERLRQARDRAVVKLCATQRWLEDAERQLAEQVEELETLRGRSKNMSESFGERIKERRLERGFGLREAAKLFGISPTYLSRIENRAERNPPKQETIEKIAEVLQMDFDELMRLAGRFTDDVKEFLTQDEAMPASLREAREENLSGRELLEMLRKRRQGNDDANPFQLEEKPMMIGMNFQTEPGFDLNNITLDTVRPWLSLRNGKTGKSRWAYAVISLLTMSPRERASWLISSSAEGCYPVQLTKEQAAVWKRICLELDMVSMTDKEEFLDVAYNWMQYAFDGDELILQEDDKEEILTGHILRDLMRALLLKSSALQESLRRHALKHKSLDTWFTDNDGLIAEEAWHYDWPSLVYG